MAIIADLRGTLELMERAHANEIQIGYHRRVLADAKKIKMSRAVDVLEPEQLEFIRRVIRPEMKQCYKNATNLCIASEGDFEYCEGFVDAGIGLPIAHAFNKYGEYYIDITFEFALNDDPTKREYVVLAEYDHKQTEEKTQARGYYGELYNTDVFRELKEKRRQSKARRRATEKEH